MHRGFGNMRPGMFFTWIIPIVLILIIGVAFYMVINNKYKDNKTRSNSALDILNERFAKGEIDEEEYNRRKKILKD